MIPIRLSQKAAKTIAALMRQHGLGDGFGLRITVDGAAEGADRYSLNIEEGPAQHDRDWVVGGVPVFCDGKTYLFLGDITIDYDADRAGFVVQER